MNANAKAIIVFIFLLIAGFSGARSAGASFSNPAELAGGMAVPVIVAFLLWRHWKKKAH